VAGLVEVLPTPDWASGRKKYGARADESSIAKALQSGKTMREVWLADAYILRSQYGHGRVIASPYKSKWNQREHLLLNAVIVPLYVKGILAKERFYEFTDEDDALNISFDVLATLAPFDSKDEMKKWHRTISAARSKKLSDAIYAAARKHSEGRTDVDEAMPAVDAPLEAQTRALDPGEAHAGSEQMTVLFDCECTPFTPRRRVELCLESAREVLERTNITHATRESVDRCVSRMTEYLRVALS
jgi:hypothetical protein